MKDSAQQSHGKDKTFVSLADALRKVAHSLVLIPRFPFLAVIWLYQRTISPDHGVLRIFFPNGYCRFSPSCSQYGYESFRRFGVIRGIVLTTYRIWRCNPFNRGGVDPVPHNFSDIRHIK